MQYWNEGYLHLGRVLSDEMVAFSIAYFQTLVDAERVESDPTIAGALRAYGDPVFDTLLVGALPMLSNHIERPLLPTYSYVRLYRKGQALRPHRDRDACEHSVTVHLGSSSTTVWPLQVETLTSGQGSVDLSAGDGMAYLGTEVAHWRDACAKEWYLQLFLHYVERDGPHAGLVYDQRPSLGRNIEERVA